MGRIATIRGYPRARPSRRGVYGGWAAPSHSPAASERRVGGYNFEEAAREAPGTKDFHSADGHHSVTHRDPDMAGQLRRLDWSMWVKVAANYPGQHLLSGWLWNCRWTSARIDTEPDPGPDHLRHNHDHGCRPAGAYNDIVKTAEANGIPVATTNSFDPTILNRSGLSHTGQDAASAAAIGW